MLNIEVRVYFYKSIFV